MKTLVAVLAAALFLPSLALGQVSIDIHLPLPPVPPLVVVAPGIQVVEDFQEEVFFHSGFYWTRRDDRWYRAPKPQAAFAPVEVKAVPVELHKLPPGHYKHWKKAKHEAKEDRKELREDRKELKEDRQELKEDRKELREDKHEKHHGKGKK